MSTSNRKIIIKGVTEDGRRFRPSDWAQRLATAVGSLGTDRRIRFHPQVSIGAVNGVTCVMVDAALEEEDPQLYGFLLNFGRSNHLQIETRDLAGA